MKKVKFAVGDRVAQKPERYEYDGCDEPGVGTVMEGTPSAGHTLVQWDLHEWQVNEKPVTEEVQTKLLVTVAEVKAQFSELEEEYLAYVKQAEVKLKEASKLIKEANKIAKKAGAESLADFHDAYGPLYSALDDAGWRTSSFGC